MESFAHQIKQKIFDKKLGANCCRRAFFFGLCAALLQKKDDTYQIILPLEDMQEPTAALLRNLFKKDCQTALDPRTKRTAMIFDGAQIDDLLLQANQELSLAPLLPRMCPECKKRFLRGAFIGGGRVIPPEKGYSLELDCKERSPLVAAVAESAELSFRHAQRRGRAYLYLKKSTLIEDFFVYIGEQDLSISIMNEKIKKEYRNNANRLACCESNNIAKSVQSAGEQIDMIERLVAADKLSLLPIELQEAAKARLEYREASLTALGMLLTPPLTKSGVSHRLQKVMEFAKKNL
ncbi:MAG: DNA-binding protein WhiA [Clostridia bacterium]|nr:DNA-binding protein WhiA [Clostridia bacterium]